jgi:hypothetical protein
MDGARAAADIEVNATMGCLFALSAAFTPLPADGVSG